MRATVLNTLAQYLADQGLKQSRQRDLVVQAFLDCDDHVTVEEVLAKAREEDGRISPATVYRTMRLLQDAGVAFAHNFQDGLTRYEHHANKPQSHHDHVICTQCGAIAEFFDQRIEDLQIQVAKSLGYVVSHHKMELYGVCATCRTSGALSSSS